MAGKLCTFEEGFGKTDQVENAKAEFVVACLKLQQHADTLSAMWVVCTRCVTGDEAKLIDYLQTKLGIVVECRKDFAQFFITLSAAVETESNQTPAATPSNVVVNEDS